MRAAHRTVSMTRATRQTLIVLLAVSVLAAVIAYDRRGNRTPAIDPLLPVDVSVLSTIDLVCNGCTPLRFARRGRRWHLVAPWSLPADSAAVARLLDIAALPALRRFDADAIDRQAAGLLPPLATLRLGVDVLEFGTTDAIDNHRYVAVNGRVALVQDRFSAWLLSGPERYASMRPLAGLREPVAVADSAWNGAQVALLRRARALDVRLHDLAPPADAAMIGDTAGRALAYWWHPQTGDVLLRAEPPLAYMLPADTARAVRAARAR